MKVECELRRDEQQSPGGSRRILMSIVALGLLVRGLHWWAISQTAWPRRYLTAFEADDYAFFQWAKTILAGDLLGRQTYHPYFSWMERIAPLATWYQWWGGRQIFHQAPFYPYFLAGSLALFRESASLVLLFQLMIGALQPLIMYSIAAHLYDRKVGLVAAALAAFYGPFIFYETVFLRDWLPPILEPLAVLVLLKAKKSAQGVKWALAGAALGLALLTKESALLLILFAVAWVILSHWRLPKRALAAGIWTVVGLVLILSPLFLRNLAVGAPLFALSNRAAEAFAVANKPYDSSEATLGRIMARSDGGVLSSVQETVRSYQGNWRGFARRQIWKLLMLKDPYEYPNNTSIYYGRELSPVVRWALGYTLVFPLGLAGFILSLKDWRTHALVYLYGAATVGGLLAINAMSRYRLALVPFLILYGAAILVRLATAIREKNARRALGIAGLVMSFALLQHAYMPLPQEMKWTYPVDYSASAKVYAQDKQFDRAVLEMVRLRSKLTGGALADRIAHLEGDYRILWARELVKEGKEDEAKKQAGLAEAAFIGHQARGFRHFNLGILYLALDETEKGKFYLKLFLKEEPKHPQSDRARRLLVETP